MAEAGHGALREIAAVFGIEWDDKELKKGEGSLHKTIEAVKALGAAFVGSELVKGIREFAENFTVQASFLKASADRMGVTTEQMQELAYAATRGSIGLETLNMAMATLSKKSASAMHGNTTGALKALGVSARDAHGKARPITELMTDIANSMSRVHNPAKKLAIANELFGRSGQKMLTILHAGEGGMEDLRKEITALGGGMDEEGIKAAEEYEKNLTKFRFAMISVANVVARDLLPALAWLQSGVAKLAAWWAGATKGTNIFAFALGGLGVIALLAGKKMFMAGIRAMMPWIPIIAAVAILVLIFDDLLTLFQGGDSVIGRFIDSLYGAGTAKQLAQDLQAAWSAFVDFMKVAAGWLSNVLGKMFDNWISNEKRWWKENVETAQMLMDVFSKAWGFVKTTASKTFDWVLAKMEGMWGNIAAIAKKLGIDLGNPFVHSMVPETPIHAPGIQTGAPEFAGPDAAGRDQTPGTRLVNTPAPPMRVASLSRTNNTTINVNGAGDPHTVAREVERRRRSTERAQNDADHPLPPMSEVS